MAKKKKATRGGQRPGAGHPFTGINTVRLQFIVHKDLEEAVTKKVRAMIAEFKAKQNGAPLPADYVKAEKIVLAKSNGKAEKLNFNTQSGPKSATITVKPVSAYLESRRKLKAGVK